MGKQRCDIRSEKDIIIARQIGRELAQSLGFGTADQTRLATAISELTRNVIQYAGSGVCLFETQTNGKLRSIRVIVEDTGPGIEDLSRAMKMGFSTKNGLGAGLPGTKKLVHDFKIDSKPGHTVVTIVMSKRI